MKKQNKSRLITGIIIALLSVMFTLFGFFSNSFRTTLLVLGIIFMLSSFIPKIKKKL
jgi:uncharacterized membrane protein